MKKIKSFTLAVIVVMLVTAVPWALPAASAAPAKASYTSPEDRQIIPFYEVWLRWNGVSGISHYILKVRDVTPTTGGTGVGGVVPINENGPMVYTEQYVSAGATSFVIPLSRLQRGHYYRWCLYTYDSAGNKSYCGARTFKLEAGVNESGVIKDSHIWKKSYPSASSINYFIDARGAGDAEYSQYDGLIQSSIIQWNGVSSNVYLYRDYSDTTKKLGVYVGNTGENYVLGRTYRGGIAVNDQYAYLDGTFNYVDIVIDKGNIDNNHSIGQYSQSNGNYQYHQSVVMHEIGHALSLGHTDGKDSSITYTSFTRSNKIHEKFKLYSSDDVGNIPLLMNGGIGADSMTTTFVDRDHLRIKWGA
ncbi:MAG: hypothetical protein J6K66_00175 [Clostridia bacterium]|nr:hypothetical protein [Clostridia bacterium]